MGKHLLLRLAIAASIVASAAIAIVLAGTAGGSPDLGPAPPDVQFVSMAARDGLAELRLSRLAQQKSSSEKVKAAARWIEIDQEQASTELKALAARKKIPATDSGDDAQPQVGAPLDRLSGAAFDRAWAQRVVADHAAAIVLFTQVSRNGRDAEIRAFAGSQLPALRAHLTHAQNLLKAGGARGRR